MIHEVTATKASEDGRARAVSFSAKVLHVGAQNLIEVLSPMDHIDQQKRTSQKIRSWHVFVGKTLVEKLAIDRSTFCLFRDCLCLSRCDNYDLFCEWLSFLLCAYVSLTCVCMHGYL